MTMPTDPTVLWRLKRRNQTAHATLLPGDAQTTITWLINGVMDRVENYDALELAMARADQIRRVLLEDGWEDTT